MLYRIIFIFPITASREKEVWAKGGVLVRVSKIVKEESCVKLDVIVFHFIKELYVNSKSN